MKKRPTLADVARAAGVSMMTVSRAINNKPGLSNELRQKILKIANEMDYQPSKIARGLATSQTATVGLVVSSISNPFYAQLAQGVEEVATKNGYNVFLINTNANVFREEQALDSLWAHQIDGAILASFRLPQKDLEKSIQRFPAVVLFNRQLSTPLPNVVTVCVNDQRGAQTAVQHLLKTGRRCIAYIGAPENSYSSQYRLEGYRAALVNANVPFNPALFMRIIPGIESGREATEALLRRDPGIDAILAFNDLTAIGALQACQGLGKMVPEQVAIIGADNIPMASLIHPSLTSSYVDMEEIGRLSMRTLLALLAGKAPPASYTIEPELVVRESA